MNTLVKYTIIFLNTAIRMIVIAIIQKVGHDNESAQMRQITEVVFACQFFNTGFLLMLCSANFQG
jgi:glucose uptake protein GlcU